MDKGVISVVTVLAYSLFVGPGSAGFLLTGRKNVREEKFTVHSISLSLMWGALVGRVAGAVASTNCSIHVPNNDGSAVVVSVIQSLDVLFNSASEGFLRAT
eukprot:1154016-Pelagomonas_calceolata.AAC.4